MSKHRAKTVLAGGAVVQRARPGRPPEILIIHRGRYSDWTLPKGKVEAGESVVAAAAREVREETGVTIRLGNPLDTVQYALGSGATKEVRYWCGEPMDVTKRAPDDEERYALLQEILTQARSQGVQGIDISRDNQGKVDLSVPQWFSAALNEVMFKGGFQGVARREEGGKSVYQTFIHTSVVSNPVVTGSANQGPPAAKPNQQGNR